MTVKLLNEHNLEFLSLQGGCTGSSETTLVKMPHCWKSCVTAQMLSVIFCDAIRVKLCPGLQIRVRTGQLFFLFPNQDACCGYSKEPSQ